jgi:catechol 2,3-dioxygenase-like lactoylglutathione lyase family enzyme
VAERPAAMLAGIVLGAPAPGELARFYAGLLGWAVVDSSPEWVRIEGPGGRPSLGFQLEEQHVPPVWPARAGEQQMMIHLDVLVADLDAAGAHAVALGARPAGHQPRDGVRVYLDPAGHPFCLFVAGA